MKVKKCWKCKEEFREDELIQYVSPGMKTLHNYCKKCFQEQQDFDALKMKIVSIFGSDEKLWPRVMVERKRLKAKYGYTDQTIIDCLDYVYNVKKEKILSRSLYRVTPTMIEEMKKYKRSIAMAAGQVVAAAKIEIVDRPVTIQENTTEKTRNDWDIDEWLE